MYSTVGVQADSWKGVRLSLTNNMILLEIFIYTGKFIKMARLILMGKIILICIWILTGIFLSMVKFILNEKIHFIGNLHFNETNTMASPYFSVNHSELF
jgi:hypothetical protein